METWSNATTTLNGGSSGDVVSGKTTPWMISKGIFFKVDMNLKFYCGDWLGIPEEIRKTLSTADVSTYTQEQMVGIGNLWCLASEDAPVMAFSNVDHILNGIRLYIMRKNQGGPAGYWLNDEPGVTMHFFNKEGVEQVLPILKGGRLRQWPAGCFDENQKNLIELGRGRHTEVKV